MCVCSHFFFKKDEKESNVPKEEHRMDLQRNIIKVVPPLTEFNNKMQ